MSPFIETIVVLVDCLWQNARRREMDKIMVEREKRGARTSFCALAALVLYSRIGGRKGSSTISMTGSLSVDGSTPCVSRTYTQLRLVMRCTLNCGMDCSKSLLVSWNPGVRFEPSLLILLPISFQNRSPYHHTRDTVTMSALLKSTVTLRWSAFHSCLTQFFHMRTPYQQT